MTNPVPPPTPSDALIAIVAAVAAEAQTALEPRRLPVCLTYEQAGEQLGTSSQGVRRLVDRGVLVRPAWSLTERKVAVVTTASVLEAGGWPIVPVELAVPAKGAA